MGTYLSLSLSVAFSKFGFVSPLTALIVRQNLDAMFFSQPLENILHKTSPTSSQGKKLRYTVGHLATSQRNVTLLCSISICEAFSELVTVR